VIFTLESKASKYFLRCLCARRFPFLYVRDTQSDCSISHPLWDLRRDGCDWLWGHCRHIGLSSPRPQRVSVLTCDNLRDCGSEEWWVDGNPRSSGHGIVSASQTGPGPNFAQASRMLALAGPPHCQASALSPRGFGRPTG
jgi:hypothetical protein